MHRQCSVAPANTGPSLAVVLQSARTKGNTTRRRESRGGQGQTAEHEGLCDAQSLVHLLFAFVLRVCDEPRGLFLWSFEGVGMDGDANGG